MSNNAMSNETDLDWLARNVHAWPTNTPKAILPGDATFKLGAVFYGDCVAFSGELGSECRRVNKADWLARRAELQNKPSWDDAPEWGEWLAQDDSGEWYWYASKQTHQGMKSWWPAPGANNMQCGKGEVLGDWRDTLEKRPEKTIVDICGEVTQENRHEQIFETFVSVEDSQEKEMKQDNGWFERGELPPVGTVCEYTLGANAPWYQCEIKYVIRGNGVVMKRIPCGGEQYCGLLHRNPVSFRPVRTERDALLSIIVEEMNRYDTDGKLADAILAAGFSLRDK